MTLKESRVTTGVFGIEGKEEVPVYYSDELQETSVCDIAYCSAIEDYLPYIFIGFFSDGKKFNRWYFANARRHEDMREAVTKEIGDEYQYSYGQIWFRGDRQDGLQFSRAIIRGGLPEKVNKATIARLLIDVIDPDFLFDQLTLYFIQDRTKYIYVKATGLLAKY